VKTIRACIAAAVAIGLLPATAAASTVSVTEDHLSDFPPTDRSTLTFEAAPGEDNIATIAPTGEESGRILYEVRDLHEPLTAGPGCSGGGGPDTPVTCPMSRSRPVAGCGHQITCSDGGRPVYFRFDLADGNDELRAALLPADDGGGGLIEVLADGGVGDDQLYTGPTNDTIDPGPGADTVRSNQGDDVVDAGDSPDGPDYFDLRDGLDTIDYDDAAQPVTITIDSRADDGAAGEGDMVVDAEELRGTPGADTIAGVEGDVAEELIGNGGGDVLIGNGGPDSLSAAPIPGVRPDAGTATERDILRGGPGNDFIFAYAGGDRIAGGTGDDSIDGMAGEDRVGGGEGRDVVDGGKDSDRLSGGPGRDRLEAGKERGEALDEAPDTLDCGASRHDQALEVERHDRAKHCERVRAGSP
jgi:Ca2+-binding RTX toxin-like protein